MKSPPRTTNLAAAASSFVGRDTDIAAVAARLEEGRLVTVLGPGGVGKTRVALRFAEERVAAFSAHRGGGVWFCDLSEARGLTDIVATVAAALGVTLDGHDGSGAALAEALGRAIARRGRILLVLDNFDRLTADGAATVGVWLRAASSARFLVTSRGPLDLMGEQLWSLSPLPQSEAVELFVRRARQVQPTFEVGPDGDTVAAIVDAIDRLPLAIELAASRMAVLSTSQLRERLARPLAILAGRREVGRHASMRRTVLDSVEILSPAQRGLFAACAVMRNGFTLEAAEAVLVGAVAPREAILDGLAALVQNSLLRMTVEAGDAAARYGYFETIRDVAEELGAREAGVEATRARHATYYAALATRVARAVGRQSSGDLASLGRDLENLQQAHREAVALAVKERSESRAREGVEIALALERVLSARGLLRVSAELFDGALSALDAVDSHDAMVRAEVHLARGLARRELGESALALADFEAGRRDAEAADNPGLAAVALTRLGDMKDLAGDTEEARVLFDAALALLVDAPHDDLRALREAEAYLGTGHARRREGDLAGARSAIGAAIDRYRGLGADQGVAEGMYELAVIDMFAGRHVDAFARFDEGLVVATRGGVRVAIGALKTARGCLLQDLGRLDEALEHHAEAARIFQEVGSRYREASATYYVATTYLERGEPGEAESMLRRARALVEGIGASRYEALIAGCLASALAASGDASVAEAAMDRAERAAALVRNEAALTCNVRIHRLALELRKRAWRDAEEAVDEATRLVAASPSDDSRFALRVLRAALKGESRDHEALVVWPAGRAFRAPGASAAVELPTRSPLRRLLEHLARRRIESPGEVVTIEELVGVGWPSEKIGTEAALNRAYVALASLRKLGLRGLLLHGGGGYALSQAVVVRVEDKASSRSD